MTDGAPIICDLDCLDGFVGSMPTGLLPDQPESLCGNSGEPNNLSWFAFVAGANNIDITITPFNCIPSPVLNNNPSTSLVGVQAGVYSSCSFTEEDIVVCVFDCATYADDPVNLQSDQYEIGEVYYMFVDGCGGSVCDYTVTVNTASQAFEVPEITTITNEYNFDLENDTICQGAEVAFRLDDLDLNIDFSWSIEPPTTEYPSGMHPLTDTNTVSFVFTDEGVFDIIVFASNECDANEPDTFQVVVAALGDEVFSEVSVCEECLINGITLVAPDQGCIIDQGTPLILTEDPNGDGVTGWQGLTEINGPGLQTKEVTNALGCSYTQFVTVDEIPLSPRSQIDVYFCFSDFPVVYDGLTYVNPGDERNITSEGGAASGCDSLINITANAIDLIGSAIVMDCEDGIVPIGFDIILVEPSDYDSITYSWIDANGDVLLDDDDIDDILKVNIAGSYSVKVTVYKNGASCSQLFGSYEVDAMSLTPMLPEIAFAPNQICITNEVAKIYVDNQGLSEDYTWEISPPLPFITGQDTDTIYVDITSGEDFQFCVSASNGCGDSPTFCDDVIVSEVPDPSFTSPLEVCVDSILVVEYAGGGGTTTGSEFYWAFDGGEIVNTANLLSAGPFEIQFPSAGDYTLSLYISEGGCTSEVATQSVKVTEPFTLPVITCYSLRSGVAFSFDDTNITGLIVDVLSGQNSEIIGTDSIYIGNLGPEELVDIEILFNDDHVCGGQSVSTSCESLPCPAVELNIGLSTQGQCIDNDDQNILLDIIVTGDISGVGVWQSPFLVGNDQFDVASAGIGEHTVRYEYEVAGCTFSRDTTISIFGSPLLLYTAEEVFCNDVLTTISVDNNGMEVMINDESVADPSVISITNPDIYTISIIDENGCTTDEVLEINMREIDPSLIIGDRQIVLGNTTTFSTNDLGDLPDVIYTWTLDGEEVCTDCLTLDLDVLEDAQLCMTAYYSDDCSQEVCIDLSVLIIAELYVPNVFSPNGDDVNDFFKFQSNSQDLMIEKIAIFDRWGEIVFESAGSISNEEAIMWDGKLNGSPVNDGVYLYIIQYLDLDGDLVTKTGDITLLR